MLFIFLITGFLLEGYIYDFYKRLSIKDLYLDKKYILLQTENQTKNLLERFILLQTEII